jgi:hypothetical protein
MADDICHVANAPNPVDNFRVKCAHSSWLSSSVEPTFKTEPDIMLHLLVPEDIHKEEETIVVNIQSI